MVTIEKLIDRQYLTIEHDHDHDWISVTWRGYLTSNQLRVGYEEALKLLQERHVGGLLMNAEYMIGNWGSITSWLAWHWLPRALKAGLNRIAYVYPAERLERLQTTHPFVSEEVCEIRSFATVEAAEEWLRPL